MTPDADSQLFKSFPFLAKIELLPEWRAAADAFLSRGGTCMVLGAPDTGKSTLSRYLVSRAYGAGRRVALVDLDVGQSHLGPPTTLGLGLYPPRLPGDGGLHPEACYFIGQTSPVGALLEVAVGCRVLVDLAAAQGVRRVVVNTSGLVQGPPAVRLKRAEVELLKPSLIFGLERGRELEPLLRHLACDQDLLRRLPVSSRVVRRSPEERRRYREERFRRYFEDARPLSLPWRPLVWEGLPLGRGRPLNSEILQELGLNLGARALYGESQGRLLVLLLEEAPAETLDAAFQEREGWEKMHWLSWPRLHYRLVGLLDAARRNLALGLILPYAWDPELLGLWTPLPEDEARRVRFLKVSRLRVTPEGQELGSS